jgi:hypothetical protein
MDELPSNPRAIYMKSLRWSKMTTLPLQLKGRYTPLRGNLVKTWIFPSGGHAFAAVRVLPTQTTQSRCVSPASKLLGAPGSHLRPLILRSWLCAAIKEPDGFVVNRRKPRELSVASTPLLLT